MNILVQDGFSMSAAQKQIDEQRCCEKLADEWSCKSQGAELGRKTYSSYATVVYTDCVFLLHEPKLRTDSTYFHTLFTEFNLQGKESIQRAISKIVRINTRDLELPHFCNS